MLAGCTVGPPTPTLDACPQLLVGEWEWIGVVGPPGTVEPYDQIALSFEGEQLAYVRATHDGGFAIRGAIHGRVGRSVAHVTTASGRDFLVRPGDGEALISYPAGSRPVVEVPGGRMQFEGSLARTRESSPIRRAWVFDWNSDTVEQISPTPELEAPFTTSIPGGVWHCLGIYTEHVSGRTGGCWWPRGGGCLCRHCTVEEQQNGTCIETVWPEELPPLPCGCNPTPPPPSDAPDSGRAPLPVGERHDPPPEPDPHGTPPPPNRGDDIPLGSGVPPAPDAWVSYPDAGPPDDTGAVPF